MPYTPAKGGTLLIPSGPPNDSARLHLHVILTDRCENGQHLMVCIESIIDGVFHDDACELEPHSHPFIKKKSYVNYRRAKTISSKLLQKCVDGWLYKPKEPISDQLLSEICEG